MAASVDQVPKKEVRIDCGDYLMRTVTADDASECWAAWMQDPEIARMLNAPARQMSKADIAQYIATFDQRSDLLLGIFEKARGSQIGFFTIQADFARSQGVVNLLIGEAAYRHHGVLTAIRLHIAKYFFETLGLKAMMATALARNRIMIDTLLKAGWHLDATLKGHVKDHAGGPNLDLCLLSLSREAWRARNSA